MKSVSPSFAPVQARSRSSAPAAESGGRACPEGAEELVAKAVEMVQGRMLKYGQYASTPMP